MVTGVLLVYLLAVWALWFVSCVAEASLSDVRRGVPEGERHGVSLFPVIPVFPLVAWAIALLVDRFYAPWGTVSVASIHLVLVVVWGVSLFRDMRELKRIDGAQ